MNTPKYSFKVDPLLSDMISGAPVIVTMLMKRADIRTRDAIARYVAEYLNQALEADRSPPVLDEECASLIQKVRAKGCGITQPLFSPSDIAEIEAYLADKPLFFYGPEPEDLPETTGLLHERPSNYRFGSWQQPIISSCPAIMAAAHDPRLLALAEAYLGAPPTLRHIDLWWSFPNAGGAWGIQKFHYDVEDFRTLKLFVYLSDVGADDGPHEFVEESHCIEALDQFARRHNFTPGAYDEFLRWLSVRRKSESEIRSKFDTVRTIMGPKGLTFVADTRGVHRGVPPISGNRLMFELCYCCVPMRTKKHNVPVKRDKSVYVDEDIARATRLFYC